MLWRWLTFAFVLQIFVLLMSQRKCLTFLSIHSQSQKLLLFWEPHLFTHPLHALCRIANFLSNLQQKEQALVQHSRFETSTSSNPDPSSRFHPKWPFPRQDHRISSLIERWWISRSQTPQQRPWISCWCWSLNYLRSFYSCPSGRQK